MEKVYNMKIKTLLHKTWEIIAFFWYIFQKPIILIILLALLYNNTDYLIITFKKSADWIAKQAGVTVTDRVIVLESKKPKRIKLPKGLKTKPDEGFMWPVTGPISSPFGPRWGNEFHHGLDVAVPQGTQVASAKDGIVIKAGWSNIYGNYVQIDHGNGYSTVYGHNSLLYARLGQFIQQGDIIALSGSTGRSTGPHVHFEVRINNKAVNPLALAYDGIERQAYEQEVIEAAKIQAEEKVSPDEINRKYIITLEKTKKLKLETLNTNIKEALKHWDATIAFQYRASFGDISDINLLLVSIENMNSSLENAMINVSELLPILAAQIQFNNAQTKS